MKRLTYDFCIGGNHCWQVKGADNLECREVCERQGDDGCKTCPIAKAFDRLATIEDILGDEYDLDELREMVQAKREGRCVVLPCKVGDEIYQPTRDFISTFRVRYIEISACGNLFINTSLEDGIVFNGLGFPESELGKTVFLTRSEAENALKAREQE